MGVACGCGLMSAFRRQFLYCFGHRAVSTVRSSEVVHFSEVLNTLFYGKFNWCFDGCPFYGGRPLLGGSTKRAMLSIFIL